MAKTPQNSSDAEVGYELNKDSLSTGKGRPTPTRKEKEEARKQPLVSSDRAAAKKQARATMAIEREKARIGMAAGEEKYLPIRDRGVQKRWIRDYVDARFSAGELLIPLMFVVLMLTFIPQPEFQFMGFIALWGFLLVAIIDSAILGYIVRKKLGMKFGPDKVERGVRWYAAMRAMQLRVMRLPKPQVKRGKFPA